MIWTLVFIFGLLHVISAQSGRIYIVEPNNGNSWNPGSNVAIKWIPVSGPPPSPSTKFSIDLMDGDAQNANLVAHISDNVPGTASQYNWIVPANMERRNDYFIRISAIDNSGVNYYYSGRYGISGDVMAATKVHQPWEMQKPSSQIASKPANPTVSLKPISSASASASAPVSSYIMSSSAVSPTSSYQETSIMTSSEIPSTTTTSESTTKSARTSTSTTTKPNEDEKNDDEESSSLALGLFSLGLFAASVAAVVLV